MSSSPPPSTSPETKAIIVGAGFAGLTAAIELHRHSIPSILIDSFPSPKVTLGDIISFAPNSGNIISKWPGVAEALDPICIKTEGLHFRNWDGEYLFYQKWDEKEKEYGRKFNGHRGEIHAIFFEHARSLPGVQIRLGEKVVDYFETTESAGVLLESGEALVADVVLGSDGVRSKARTLVLGFEDKPKSSGYAIYRAWFEAEKIRENPRTRFLVENGDYHGGWLGPDIHFLAASVKGGKDLSWVCTHKEDDCEETALMLQQDEADVEEGWQIPGTHADAHKVLEGWDPVVHDIIDATPFLVDWKLVYRDPLPTWVSPQGRIALIGDAAHPFLPTSIQGASQAMEDGATVAVCLEKTGKADVPLALKAFERIRYERVLRAQKTGEKTRDRWHKADFGKVKEDLESLKLVREEWLLNFDAEMHAYDVWDDVVKELRDTGTKKEMAANGVDGVNGSLHIGAAAIATDPVS